MRVVQSHCWLASAALLWVTAPPAAGRSGGDRSCVQAAGSLRRMPQTQRQDEHTVFCAIWATC